MEDEDDVLWSDLEWDVTKPPARATIEGCPLTDAQWQQCVRGVQPVICVPWGACGVYAHDVPIPMAVPDKMTLREAVSAISTHMRRLAVTPKELSSVIAYEEAYGSRRAAQRMRDLQGTRTHPMHLLGSRARWAGLSRDEIEPQVLVLRLL
jgi:hypothetical protein